MKDAFGQLIAGEVPYIVVGCDRLPERAVLLPGSFNPLHRGHEGLLLAAEKATGRDGLLELSVSNVDKPPVPLIEVERRLLQMKGIYSVVLTAAPTFAEKAERLPGSWFAMGYDTVSRLLSPAYHENIPAMLDRFTELETRFVVSGRLVDGAYRVLEDLDIPGGYEKLFIPVPEAQFREDISSTELRGGAV